MPETYALSTEQQILIAVVLGGLFGISRLFNAYIDHQTDTDPEGPGSGIYVVLGVAYTLAGAAALLWIVFGFLAAMWVIVITAACFVFSGIPMIFGGLRRTSQRRHAKYGETQRQLREAEVKEWADGDSR